MAPTNKFEPQEVVIRHGLFWYFSREQQVVSNKETGRLEEVEVLVQRTASQNDKVTLVLESDYQRGLDHDAFWSEEQLKSGSTVQAPALTPAGAPGTVPSPTDDDDDAPVDPTDVEIGELDNEGIRDWLTGTGEFDGSRQPNAKEVVAAVGDDPELAERTLAAESATREKPRTEVESGLNKVMEKATA